MCTVNKQALDFLRSLVDVGKLVLALAYPLSGCLQISQSQGTLITITYRVRHAIWRSRRRSFVIPRYACSSRPPANIPRAGSQRNGGTPNSVSYVARLSPKALDQNISRTWCEWRPLASRDGVLCPLGFETQIEWIFVVLSHLPWQRYVTRRNLACGWRRSRKISYPPPLELLERLNVCSQ